MKVWEEEAVDWVRAVEVGVVRWVDIFADGL
jgi:hypothetical protein